jgi:hypothetical protein
MMSRMRDYFDLLDAIHRATLPRTYVEIGVATGKSMSIALPGTVLVGVDPSADVRHPISGDLHLFRMTSDEFFQTGSLQTRLAGLPIDIGFIDGLHYFDAVLRDFRGIEAASAPESVVLIHDCIPVTTRSAARQRETKIWTGDVWKAIVGLRRYRPDLTITVVKIAPTGLALVTGLQPKSRVLFDRYEELCSSLSPLSLPEDPSERNRMIGAQPLEWELLRGQLPVNPYRDVELAPLLAKRRRKRATWTHVEWSLRRGVRYSPVGRFLGGREEIGLDEAGASTDLAG